MLKAKTGLEFRSPSDCSLLAEAILSKTGRSVSMNTLKRLIGIVDDERMPHQYTLDAIACFVGSENWDTLQTQIKKGNSDFAQTANEIRSCDLEPSTKIRMTYQPDRCLIMEYMGNDCYRIIESFHSKLHIGDIIKIEHMVKGFPLLAQNVMRYGENLGSFTAGETSGVNFEIL
ncbi:MAG: hypothetical protein Q3994_07800 [Prevotella sp.]|nr:hypothetical protein [Prevotella sp.]